MKEGDQKVIAKLMNDVVNPSFFEEISDIKNIEIY